MTDLFDKGISLYLDHNDPVGGLRYLLEAAKGGYKQAYGQIAIIIYREKNDVVKAEKWFKAEMWFRKAEEIDCLEAPNAHTYGMLLIEERGDVERGNYYLDKAAKEGFE